MRPRWGANKIKQFMLAWFARTAPLTAMRQGEILSLQFAQIDLERRIVCHDRT